MVIKDKLKMNVRVDIKRNGVEISGESKDVKEGIKEKIILRIKKKSVNGK
jgi:hypothetical protein